MDTTAPAGALASGRAFADLSSWRKVAVSGPDARKWLNDLVSTDTSPSRRAGVGVGTIESVIDRDVAARAMESLSVSERTLLSLAYLQGMTAREIAEADGIPLGTVKTRLRSALIKLRRAGVKEPT